MMTDEKLAMMTPIDLSPEAVAKRKKEEAEAERRAEEERANQRSVVKPPPPFPASGRKQQMSIGDAIRKQEESKRVAEIAIPEDKKELLIESAKFILQFFGVEKSDEFVGLQSKATKRDVSNSIYQDKIREDVLELVDSLGYKKELGDGSIVWMSKHFFYSEYLRFTKQDKASVSIKQLGRIMREMHFCDKRMRNELCWLFGKKK